MDLATTEKEKRLQRGEAREKGGRRRRRTRKRSRDKVVSLIFFSICGPRFHLNEESRRGRNQKRTPGSGIFFWEENFLSFSLLFSFSSCGMESHMSKLISIFSANPDPSCSGRYVVWVRGADGLLSGLAGPLVGLFSDLMADVTYCSRCMHVEDPADDRYLP